MVNLTCELSFSVKGNEQGKDQSLEIAIFYIFSKKLCNRLSNRLIYLYLLSHGDKTPLRHVFGMKTWDIWEKVSQIDWFGHV